MATIAGIFPSCEPAAIEKALASASGIDAANAKVVTKTPQTAAMQASRLDFVSVAEAQNSNSLSDDMTRNTGYMSDAGGTGVPGLSGRSSRLTDFAHGDSFATNYLAGLGVSGDVIDNYNTAIEEGRCVVVIDGDAAAAEALRAAGFKNVRVVG